MVQSSGCCKAAHFHHLCPYLLETACSLLFPLPICIGTELQRRGVCSQSVPKCDNCGVKVFGPMWIAFLNDWGRSWHVTLFFFFKYFYSQIEQISVVKQYGSVSSCIVLCKGHSRTVCNLLGQTNKITGGWLCVCLIGLFQFLALCRYKEELFPGSVAEIKSSVELLLFLSGILVFYSVICDFSSEGKFTVWYVSCLVKWFSSECVWAWSTSNARCCSS